MKKEQNVLERVYEPRRLLERRPARLVTGEEERRSSGSRSDDGRGV
jgi:hypothetical protein